METAKNYLDAWLKAQETMFGEFAGQMKKTQQLFLGQYNPALSGDAGGLHTLYSSWATNALKSMAEAGGGNIDTVKDTLSKLLGSSNAYLKLYEVWRPLLKAMHEKGFKPDAYQDCLNPAQYRELLDKVFNYDYEAVKLMLDQAVQLLELSSGSIQNFTKPWADATVMGLHAAPHFAEGHPESFIKIFHSLFNAFDNTVGRAFHVPPVGKDREKIELLLRCLDDLGVYMAKNTEYQHVMYLTGFSAMEKVVEKLADKIRLGEEIKQFDEFFDVWIDVNEQAYFKLFQTEEFSKLQGELLDAALTVRTHFHDIIEMQMEGLPVASRSEMDDLYKTVYELNKKVKKLEKRLLEQQPTEVEL